jgi:hypothetical protein
MSPDRAVKYGKAERVTLGIARRRQAAQRVLRGELEVRQEYDTGEDGGAGQNYLPRLTAYVGSRLHRGNV